LTEWHLAQQEASDQLCRLHHFAVTKPYAGGEVEFVITIREYANPPDPAMQFLAQTDKQTNQKVAPFTPNGWGASLFEALAGCIREIHRFPYEAS